MLKIVAYVKEYPSNHLTEEAVLLHNILAGLVQLGNSVKVVAERQHPQETYDGVEIFYDGVDPKDLIRDADVVLTQLEWSGYAVQLARGAQKPIAHFVYEGAKLMALSPVNCDLAIFIDTVPQLGANVWYGQQILVQTLSDEPTEGELEELRKFQNALIQIKGTVDSIDGYATETHFVDHIAPVLNALPPQRTGRLFVSAMILQHALNSHIVVEPVDNAGITTFMATYNKICLTASFLNMQTIAAVTENCILMEHGAGQSYGGSHTSYAGGDGRDNVLALLATNEMAAARNRTRYPNIISEVIGCPKLDPFIGLKPERSEKPVIAVSFHWDCAVVPETRSAFQFYRDAIANLKEHYTIIGHSHPRAVVELSNWYKSIDVEFVPSFDEVLLRANLYIIDNSSTLFEFAATDRPVVVLNCPSYRRNVHWGLRFWEFADVGVQCDHPRDLQNCIEKALQDSPEQQRLRRSISSQIYPFLGYAASRAATVLTHLNPKGRALKSTMAKTAEKIPMRMLRTVEDHEGSLVSGTKFYPGWYHVSKRLGNELILVPTSRIPGVNPEVRARQYEQRGWAVRIQEPKAAEVTVAEEVHETKMIQPQETPESKKDKPKTKTVPKLLTEG